MESTEAFEKEFSRNHKEKKEWLQHLEETVTEPAIWRADEILVSHSMVIQNLSFQSWV